MPLDRLSVVSYSNSLFCRASLNILAVISAIPVTLQEQAT